MKSEDEIRKFREQCKVFYTFYKQESSRGLANSFNIERYAAMIIALDYVLNESSDEKMRQSEKE